MPENGFASGWIAPEKVVEAIEGDVVTGVCDVVIEDGADSSIAAGGETDAVGGISKLESEGFGPFQLFVAINENGDGLFGVAFTEGDGARAAISGHLIVVVAQSSTAIQDFVGNGEGAIGGSVGQVDIEDKGFGSSVAFGETDRTDGEHRRCGGQGVVIGDGADRVSCGDHCATGVPQLNSEGFGRFRLGVAIDGDAELLGECSGREEGEGLSFGHKISRRPCGDSSGRTRSIHCHYIDSNRLTRCWGFV